jgi:hypothetical protein
MQAPAPHGDLVVRLALDRIEDARLEDVGRRRAVEARREADSPSSRASSG